MKKSEVLDAYSLLRGEDFSFSLDVLYVGRGKNKMQFFDKKIPYKFFFPAVNFFQFSVIITLDLDPDPDPDPDPDLDPNLDLDPDLVPYLDRH